MKKNILSRSLLIIMMIAAMSMSLNVWAQGHGPNKAKKGMNQGKPAMHMKMMIPDLSEDQKSQIKNLRMQMTKETTPIKAQIREKKAHLNTLSIAEKPDMKAINKTIDEIGALQVKIMKAHAKMRQDIRALLTDEQKVVFDSKAGNMKGHGAKGYGTKGYHHSKQGRPCIK